MTYEKPAVLATYEVEELMTGCSGLHRLPPAVPGIARPTDRSGRMTGRPVSSRLHAVRARITHRLPIDRAVPRSRT